MNYASVVALTLLCMALAPVWLLPHGHGLFSFALFAFFGKLCHQRPDRSLLLFGAQPAVCVRCLGIYGGAVVGSLLRLKRSVAIRALGVALALNGVDVVTESLHLHGNLPLLRLLIGAALGIAAGALLQAEDLTRHECPNMIDLPGR